MAKPLGRKKIPLSQAAQRAQVAGTKSRLTLSAPKISTKSKLQTVENLATPVHILVSGFQAEAILTLVELMRESKNDATRQKSASEILALGGNSAEMLKIQAIQSGRHKDISQMTRTEIEAFVVEARRKLTAQNDIIAYNAENVTPPQTIDIPSESASGDSEPAPWDGLNASATADSDL